MNYSDRNIMRPLVIKWLRITMLSILLSAAAAAVPGKANALMDTTKCERIFHAKSHIKQDSQSDENFMPAPLNRALVFANQKRYLSAAYQIEYLVQTGEIQKFDDRAKIFNSCLLPIYQLAADEAYDRYKPSPDKNYKIQRESEDWFIQQLLRIGEASRQAQIETAIPDGCDRLISPLRPADLMKGEIIVYPVVGFYQVYVLSAANNELQNVTDKIGTGWKFVVANANRDIDKILIQSKNLVSTLKSLALLETYDPRFIEKSHLLHNDLSFFYEYFGLSKIQIGSDEPILIFSPDPALRNIPWALLHPERQENNYLIRKTAIALMPGLAYVNPKRSVLPRRIFVTGGEVQNNGEDSSDDMLGLTALKFSQSYFADNSKSKISVDSKLVSRSNFTKQNLIGKSNGLNDGFLFIENYNALFIAAHASFEKDGKSVIATVSSESIRLNDLSKVFRYKTRRDQEIGILVLASCDGAQSDAGDLGIAGVALQSGVPSVVGSLYAIDTSFPQYFLFAPEKIGELPYADGFWNYLNSGKGIARALREAQLKSLSVDFSKEEIPIERGNFANWGAFVVVGNWR